MMAKSSASTGGNGGLATGLVWWGELLGAMLVFTFGALLLLASI